MSVAAWRHGGMWAWRNAAMFAAAGLVAAGCAAQRAADAPEGDPAAEPAAAATGGAEPESAAPESRSEPAAVDDVLVERGPAPEARIPAKELLIPRGAEWLAEPLTAEYRSLPATVAIRQVTQGRPLRLDVGGGDPLVDSPPGAVTVQEHVESICSQADWSWSAAGGVVLVTDIETRTFALAAQPGSATATMKLRGLAGESGGNEVALDLSPYRDEVGDLVRTVLGMGGEEEEPAEDGLVDPRTGVVVLPSANAVVVTARPHLMRRVEEALGRYNRATARTVRLHVALYEVETTGGEDRGVDLAALRAAAVDFGLRVTAPAAGTDGAVARLTFLEGNRADGSKAVVRWLRTEGRVSTALDDVVEVRSNAVATVDATETRQYVAKVTRATEVAGPTQLATPEVELDELRLGWSLAVQPTIVEDGVTVRIALSRRALIEERPFSLGAGAIEGSTFTTDDFNRVMSVALRNGETKLLTSLADSSSREGRRGVPWLGWLGEGRERKEREREAVLLMTAEIL